MNKLHLSNFDIHQDPAGVVTAILNVANQPINVFNEGVLHDLDEVLRAVSEDTTLRALVFRSGKENGFLAGADLHAIQSLKSAEEALEICRAGQDLFQRLASLRIPTIAVINGVCLGGGLEFVLACQYRIVIDSPKVKLGLPEVELGLLPGWGGTQRLPRRIGLSAALPMLLTGKKLGAHEACQAGLADAICTQDEVNSVIRQLLESTSPKKRNGGLRKSSLLSWVADRTPVGRWLTMQIARRGIASRAADYPALTSILTAVSAGLRSSPNDAGEGFRVERDEFAKLVSTEAHHNLLGIFFQRERARKTATWVGELTGKPRRVKKIGIVGGGVMGNGIAHWASLQGYDVVLKEVNETLLNQGVARIKDLFSESVKRHALTASEADQKLAGITATTNWQAFDDVELVIEAVTEEMSVKHAVFNDLEKYCPQNAIFVSNTSALSIGEIAKAIHDSSRVLGLHFFNPVHRMQLVEVVRTDRARNDDVAMLVEFVKNLGKVPIVTEDRPGFVVNRILFPYLDEAVRLYCEGVTAEVIDRELKRFGMPMGPLELLDQVGLDVAAHVADSLNRLSPEPSPTGNRLGDMAARGDLGRKTGRGFYLYSTGGGQKKNAVPSGTASASISTDDIRDRMVMRLINEAAKCLQEGVVAEPWMIDLGMVLGTGFAPFLGGPLRMCEQQGYGEIVAKMEYFQKTDGPRFAPAQWLIDQIGHHTTNETEHHAK